MNSFSKSHLADSLFKAESYFHASIAYEELIFNAEQPALNNYYRYHKALCYKKLDLNQKAIVELQRIFITNPSDSLFLPVLYQLSLLYYLNNEPQKALWKIDEFIFATRDSVAFAVFLPIKAMAHNELGQWGEAKISLLDFGKYMINDQHELSNFNTLVENTYSKKNLPRLVSTKKAEDLSRFIPGSGQAYAGHLGEGSINFLISLALLTFSAYQFTNGFTTIQIWNGFPITGYFAGIGFFSKIYQGGIKRAGILAMQNNQKNISSFNHEVNQLVIEIIE